VENVCLDKLHALNETRMHGFAFYESAEINVSGSFNGSETSFTLEPYSGGYPKNPNCFAGPPDLFADAGKEFELDATVTWDSAGTRVVTNFSAKTYIPEYLKIVRAYDLEGNPFSFGDTIFYLPPPMDLQANYFVPKYSDDVGGVLVSMIYNEGIYWGENSIDAILAQFRKRDTADYAFFGDKRLLYGGIKNQQTGTMNKVIDSIPVLGITTPAIGNIHLLFYASTPEYFKFEETFLGDEDVRIARFYNIQGAAGIFAGMLVDTFEINFKTPDSVKIYPYFEAQEAYCAQTKSDVRNSEQDRIYNRECAEAWDKKIWKEIGVANPPPWYEIPPEELKKRLSMDEQITWCEHRYFPIDQYPFCGSILVRYSKTGKISSVLAREVKKWCDAHPDDEACAG